ncbi:hypothetical protein ABZ553_43170 [Streptomyces sparsogenes]
MTELSFSIRQAGPYGRVVAGRGGGHQRFVGLPGRQGRVHAERHGVR